jgi:CheY-like chemotaxis protein
MDTGFGMDKNVLVHVFEPFFTTKEAGKGTGLGLATVYGIVKQSGGYIWVESKLGSGTTFEIYLPRLEGERITAPLLRSPSLSWGSETILLVEDEPSLREVTRAQLEKLGYRVHEAEDAEKAMDLFDDYVGEISLLLTDVIMPGMNGRVLAERLTEQKADLRVLYMSGYTDDEIVRQGASESNQAIMIKPFAYETLASQVREALDRKLQLPRD